MCCCIYCLYICSYDAVVAAAGGHSIFFLFFLDAARRGSHRGAHGPVQPATALPPPPDGAFGRPREVRDAGRRTDATLGRRCAQEYARTYVCTHVRTYTYVRTYVGTCVRTYAAAANHLRAAIPLWGQTIIFLLGSGAVLSPKTALALQS